MGGMMAGLTGLLNSGIVGTLGVIGGMMAGLTGLLNSGIVGTLGIMGGMMAGTLTRMAVFGLSQLLTFWETQRTNSIAEEPEFIGMGTVIVAAVLIAFISFSLKYQILFVPPVALKMMLLSSRMAVGVPALLGAAGILNAWADVPNEGKLSQPNFRQVAL